MRTSENRTSEIRRSQGASVYRLFLVNCYLLHVPRLPSQLASNVGGWVINLNWLELAWQYTKLGKIAVTYFGVSPYKSPIVLVPVIGYIHFSMGLIESFFLCFEQSEPISRNVHPRPHGIRKLGAGSPRRTQAGQINLCVLPLLGGMWVSKNQVRKRGSKPWDCSWDGSLCLFGHQMGC
jgi:hypothetical protein